ALRPVIVSGRSLEEARLNVLSVDFVVLINNEFGGAVAPLDNARPCDGGKISQTAIDTAVSAMMRLRRGCRSVTPGSSDAERRICRRRRIQFKIWPVS